MTEMTRVVRDGLVMGESPRWHDGRLWFCDWAAEELIALDPDGSSEIVARVPSFPFSIDWRPDDLLLINAARQQAVLTLQPDGELGTYADLSGLSDHPPGNEIVVDRHGNAYVNGGGFDLMAGEPFAPGMVALVAPDGSARQVAGDLGFPNGMAITADDSTLIVAESYGKRLTAFEIAGDGTLGNRRVWADLGDGVPDGICIDAEGAVWYADVPNRRCARVREGGEVLQTVELDRGAFACMLGGTDGTTLFIVAREWRGLQLGPDEERTGQILTLEVDVPHAGRP
jgi:sugar lactone lactonase YvrE